MKNVIGLTTAFLVLSGCGESSRQDKLVESQPAAGETTADTRSVYEVAVSNPARLEKDIERDTARKPAEVLEFFGIEPGMKVFDLFSGGGYYAEILSYVVGPGGKVMSHSNEAYAQYVGDEVITRYANDRLPNVEILMAENNELIAQI